MKKIGVLLFVFILIVFFTGVLFADSFTGNPVLEKVLGKVEQKETLNSNYIKTALENNVKLKNQIIDLKKKLPSKSNSLKKILGETETKNKEYELKLKNAKSKLELDEIKHSLSHENLQDKYSYVNKMSKIPETNTKISKNVRDIESEIRILKTKGIYLRDLELAIQKTKTSMPNVLKLYDQDKTDLTSKEIENLRKEVLPKLMKTEDYLKTQNPQQVQKIRNLNKELKWNIQFDLPYNINSILQMPKKPVNKDINVLVCLMRWQESDPEINIDTLVPITNKVKNYYSDVSFNKININFYYAGNVLWSGPSPENFYNQVEAAITSCDQDIDFKNIDIILVYPAMTSAAQPYPVTFLTEDGEVDMNYVGIEFDSFRSTTIEHEIGHTFGLFHSARFLCNDFPQNTECPIMEYGNPFDIMGIVALERHLNGYSKNKMGLSAVTTVTEDNSYKIGALEISSFPSKVLRIPFFNNPICIEYRKPLGYDAYPTSSEFVNEEIKIYSTPPEKGCLLTYVCPKINYGEFPSYDTILIDNTPNSHVSIDSFDACLPFNTVFSNPPLGINSLSFTPSNPLNPRTYNQHFANVNIDIDETREFE